MKNKIIAIVGILVLVVGTFATVKKVSPISWGMWGNYNTASGIALKGYDPVAYIQNSEAMPGNSEFTVTWDDADWQFASAENMMLFEQDPEAYAPQFGGFCSFAASKGFTADISPDAWHVHDGKLYVFADKNVQDDWVAGIDDGTLEASIANWDKH
ncbi:MAG: YHS domain protein [Proteobacteria bacterium]|nr:YHS domain protein [Pseudomonadota bacterium]